jgi:predicted phosphoadenosine phosphosulfate sulfurtransferase
MKIYNNENVLEAALNRIRFIFDEFPNVIVGFSGGKDSTATLHLCLQVAKEKNRLPLKVLFIDQEAEWQGTIDYVTTIMTDERVQPMWFQMPMVITNNASSYNRYSYCWDEKEKDNWIHDKNPLSIKENKYGTERFHELFEKIFAYEFKDIKSCYLSGVRTEEAPKRFVALTNGVSYKYITYGRILNKKYHHYTFYPLYDWSYTDIWKYINENNIDYNKIYDKFYQHGVSLNEMRVSNLHHETAIQSLMLVQEIEPQTWNKLAHRIDGASSIKHIKKNSYTCPKDLPYMFANWEEYAIHLAENIIQDDENKKQLYKKMHTKSIRYNKEFYTKFNTECYNAYWKAIINTILSSDWDFTKLTNFAMSPNILALRYFYNKEWDKIIWENNKTNKYLTFEQKQEIWNQLSK